MEKRCIYCSTSINQESVVDICRRCMNQVWGEKMSQAIIDGMKNEQEKGNLEQGSITSTMTETTETTEPLEQEDKTPLHL